MNIEALSDTQKAKLVENRWQSADSLWGTVKEVYTSNTKYYDNNPQWLSVLPRRQPKVRANRIFTNMESVINSLIANPPKPQIMPGRDTPESKELASLQEKYFVRRYDERNVKETIRKALRNLYFGRLLVLKPYWDAKLNDFNVKAIDPRKVRFGKTSTKEDDSEFAIEEITDSLGAVLERFPIKASEIMKAAGVSDEAQILIENPEITYKEAWIRDYVIFKFENVIMGCIRNPYWDWDGLLVTPQEEEELKSLAGDARRQKMFDIRMAQGERKQSQQPQPDANQMAQDLGAQPVNPQEIQGADQGVQNAESGASTQVAQEQGQSDAVGQPGSGYEDLRPYYFNHFNEPRKPYIFATILNNENTPIGRTDMITQAAPLQENIDATKRDITRNAHFVNGIMIIDSEVMDKAEAQRLDTEATGKIWGKGAVEGVKRETGTPLPEFVMANMQDSRSEVDNIMAASSAFRGEREGQETKAGRLALIDQSYLRLNELVQVVDYANRELFNWFYQLGKVRYTEHHYAKELGKDKAVEIMSIIQDDFEDGSEVRVIGGKTLPEDREFKYEQAQMDLDKGFLSPTDYFQVAGYNDPAEKAKNAVKYKMNAPLAVGMTQEEMQQYAPQTTPDAPSRSISFKDLPIDGQIQLAQQAGIQLDPQIMFAEKVAEQKNKQTEMQMKQQKGQPQPKQPQA